MSTINTKLLAQLASSFQKANIFKTVMQKNMYLKINVHGTLPVAKHWVGSCFFYFSSVTCCIMTYFSLSNDIDQKSLQSSQRGPYIVRRGQRLFCWNECMKPSPTECKQLKPLVLIPQKLSFLVSGFEMTLNRPLDGVQITSLIYNV